MIPSYCSVSTIFRSTKKITDFAPPRLSRRAAAFFASATLPSYVATFSGSTGSLNPRGPPRHAPVCATDASAMASRTRNDGETMGFLHAKEAYALDVDLMSHPDSFEEAGGFTLEQLMELAGLSVAEAVYDVIVADPSPAAVQSSPPSALVLCGPGNNGGDGIVAARHLVHFGFERVAVVYPRMAEMVVKNPHYGKLVHQAKGVGVSFFNEIPSRSEKIDVVVDAFFGFSFRGVPREPYRSILLDACIRPLKEKESEISTRPIVVSVDIPSGWDVDYDGSTFDNGDGEEEVFSSWFPDVLVSLTVPKICAKRFGFDDVASNNMGRRHYVGGRFLPPNLACKYGISMPPYVGKNQIVRLK